MGDDDAKAIKTELDFCKSSLEDDDSRANALIDYTKKVQDPFSDTFAGENPWVSGAKGGGGGCVIL